MKAEYFQSLQTRQQQISSVLVMAACAPSPRVKSPPCAMKPGMILCRTEPAPPCAQSASMPSSSEFHSNRGFDERYACGSVNGRSPKCKC